MPRKKDKSTAAGERFNLKEKAFIEAYADPSKPTFSIGVQAAMEAGYGGKTKDWQSNPYKAANRAAVQLLKKPKVKSEIERIFSLHKLTVDDRSRVVSDILHSPTKETIHETFDKDGALVSKQVIISSNASERLKAADIASRMDGLYTRSQSDVNLRTKVLAPMLEEYGRKLRSALQRDALQQRIEGQGETLDTTAVQVSSGTEPEPYTERTDDIGDTW
jgi:hypothetical protein